MNFLKPNFKNAAIVTTVIFAQKIYRHPDEFVFVYSEGLTVSLFAIVGFVSMLGYFFGDGGNSDFWDAIMWIGSSIGIFGWLWLAFKG